MIYLDNAATTWPKPDEVVRAMIKSMKHYGANPGRSGHKASIRASEKIYECRELISDFFGLDCPSNVVFTQNATHALNLVINGIVEKGDHVICTVMDHNSVLRPLYAKKDEIEISYANAQPDGTVDVQHLESLIKPNTKLIVMTHVSNVCGTIMPVEEVTAICRKRGILFLLDASQSAGVININMKKMNIDFLAAPGHKALYGPMGTGVLCINSASDLKPLMSGGTGSYSHELTQPSELPDRLESGTLNLPGICGLSEGIRYISRVGIDNIYDNEMRLTSYLLNNLKSINNIKIVGKESTTGRCGVVSFVHSTLGSSDVAEYLNSNFSIATRAPYHCAYMAHQALGTSDGGTVRVSLGMFNTLSEIKMLIYALKNIRSRE